MNETTTAPETGDIATLINSTVDSIHEGLEPDKSLLLSWVTQAFFVEASRSAASRDALRVARTLQDATANQNQKLTGYMREFSKALGRKDLDSLGQIREAVLQTLTEYHRQSDTRTSEGVLALDQLRKIVVDAVGRLTAAFGECESGKSDYHLLKVVDHAVNAHSVAEKELERLAQAVYKLRNPGGPGGEQSPGEASKTEVAEEAFALRCRWDAVVSALELDDPDADDAVAEIRDLKKRSEGFQHLVERWKQVQEEVKLAPESLDIEVVAEVALVVKALNDARAEVANLRAENETIRTQYGDQSVEMRCYRDRIADALAIKPTASLDAIVAKITNLRGENETFHAELQEIRERLAAAEAIAKVQLADQPATIQDAAKAEAQGEAVHLKVEIALGKDAGSDVVTVTEVPREGPAAESAPIPFYEKIAAEFARVGKPPVSAAPHVLVQCVKGVYGADDWVAVGQAAKLKDKNDAQKLFEWCEAHAAVLRTIHSPGQRADYYQALLLHLSPDLKPDARTRTSKK